MKASTKRRRTRLRRPGWRLKRKQAILYSIHRMAFLPGILAVPVLVDGIGHLRKP